jgi:hypothetical protein
MNHDESLSSIIPTGASAPIFLHPFRAQAHFKRFSLDRYSTCTQLTQPFKQYYQITISRMHIGKAILSGLTFFLATPVLVTAQDSNPKPAPAPKPPSPRPTRPRPDLEDLTFEL